MECRGRAEGRTMVLLCVFGGVRVGERGRELERREQGVFASSSVSKAKSSALTCLRALAANRL